jgi:hypothetical protein
MWSSLLLIAGRDNENPQSNNVVKVQAVSTRQRAERCRNSAVQEA